MPETETTGDWDDTRVERVCQMYAHPMRQVMAMVAILCLGAPGRGQEQQPSTKPGWPCAGRPDPTYVKTAEATGGQLFLLHPSEVADSGTLMAASFSHRDTLFRVAGPLADGLHEYTLDVDDAVESLLVSASVQCLQVVEIARPSGAVLQAAEEGVDYHQFEAGRVVVVSRPEPGAWTLRVSGSGIFFLIVQAKTTLALGRVQLVRRDARSPGELVPTFDPSRPGARQLVTLSLDGSGTVSSARLVSATGAPLGAVALRRQGDDGRWMGEFTVPSAPFRIVVSGAGAGGRPFARVHAPLLDVAGR